MKLNLLIKRKKSGNSIVLLLKPGIFGELPDDYKSKLIRKKRFASAKNK